MKEDLIKLSKKFSDSKALAEFLQQPTEIIAEIITGVLASDLKDYKLIAGRVVQGALKFRLLTQLGRELKELREKGKIKEDYFATHKQQATLVELLEFIDEEVPDEELFKAVKSIFFASISKDASEEDSLLGYHFLQICKQLKSGDILLLKTCYQILKEGKKEHIETNISQSWLSICATYSELPKGIVELYEDNLMKFKLLSGRTYSDGSGVQPGNFRLTDLAIKLCEFITRYPS